MVDLPLPCLILKGQIFPIKVQVPLCHPFYCGSKGANLSKRSANPHMRLGSAFLKILTSIVLPVHFLYTVAQNFNTHVLFKHVKNNMSCMLPYGSEHGK